MPYHRSALFSRLSRSAALWHIAILSALAYIPTLLAARGKLPTDTKLYLYLNPGRLMSDATSVWDSRQFAGSVPHQTVSYLWPSGPWYWTFDKIGVPDWIAHRLWIATLLLVAGLGVRWAGKLLGLSASACLAAAMVYQLSPYVLPYISRTSTMLLPWAGLGWMIGLTVRAATQTRWRDVALFGLLLFTVGSTNATATLMIAPAPLLWLLHAASGRIITWAKAVTTAAKIGFMSLLVCADWIVMVSLQSKYGANVLGYTETLEAVSQTATSPETVRGLGYWLFYVRDPSGFTTTAAFRYMSSGQLIVTGFLLTVVGIVGLSICRWAHRRYAIWLVLVGMVLAVGVHSVNDPSPVMSALTGNTRSSLSLALRSSSRAAPMLLFGFALGAGALITALQGRPRSQRRIQRFTQPRLLTGVVMLLALINLPALRTGEYVDPNLLHDSAAPQAWLDAAAALDALPDGFRVMQLPASESAAYRWGYTVDPPLPGLTNRPTLARDWTPLGSPAAMDLFYAFDDRFQDGTADVAAVAPLSRLLGVDTILIANDIAFDRFRSARPEPVAALLSQGTKGLGAPKSFGPPVPNEALIPMVDEQQLSDPTIGIDAPAVQLVPINAPQKIVRVKSNTVVVAGSGDGVVDAAGAGLLDGTELIQYAADFPDAAASAKRVIITDSNRDRARQWRGAQDVWGFTEDGGPESGVTKFDSADQRLAVFDNTDPATMTVVEQRGPVQAKASAYGEVLDYRPEDRAANAIDGNDETAWLVGDHGVPEGETLQLSYIKPVREITLVQPLGHTNRWIHEIEISSDSGVTQRLVLDGSSHQPTGQTVILAGEVRSLTIRIVATEADPADTTHGLNGVGFAEVRTALGPSQEVTRMPTVALPAHSSTSLEILMARLRVRPTNRFRSDPERQLTRAFRLSTKGEFIATGAARINLRSADMKLAKLLGWTGTTASTRLLGAGNVGGWNATDGDPKSLWVSAFDGGLGSELRIPITGIQPLSRLKLQQATSGDYGLITKVTVASGDQTRSVEVPVPDSSGTSTITFDPLIPNAAITLTITGTNHAFTIDRRYGEGPQLPVALREVTGAGIVADSLPASFDSGCRDDFVSVDGTHLLTRVHGDTNAALDGATATFEFCSPNMSLNASEHIVRTKAGQDSGFDIDRLLLSSTAEAPVGPPTSPDVQLSSTKSTRTATIGPCATDCWLVLGEGVNVGWAATMNGRSLGAPQPVDGGFNGWLLPPSEQERTIVMSFGPQATLNKGLAITACGVLLCIGLAIWDRKRRPRAVLAVPRFAGLRPQITRRSALAYTAIVLVLGVLTTKLATGFVCAALFALCAIGLRRPRLAGLIGGAAFVYIAVVMALKVSSDHPLANFGWTSNFEGLHQLGLAAIVLLGAAGLGSKHEVDGLAAGLAAGLAGGLVDDLGGHSGDPSEPAPSTLKG